MDIFSGLNKDKFSKIKELDKKELEISLSSIYISWETHCINPVPPNS